MRLTSPVDTLKNQLPDHVPSGWVSLVSIILEVVEDAATVEEVPTLRKKGIRSSLHILRRNAVLVEVSSAIVTP
jgi:hypothetical protein